MPAAWPCSARPFSGNSNGAMATQNFMVLIGQHASEEQANDAFRNEQRLNLALRSGGYAVWDYDYRHRRNLQLAGNV